MLVAARTTSAAVVLVEGRNQIERDSLAMLARNAVLFEGVSLL
jgi:hypothetical protein